MYDYEYVEGESEDGVNGLHNEVLIAPASGQSRQSLLLQYHQNFMLSEMVISETVSVVNPESIVMLKYHVSLSTLYIR